MYNYFNIIYDIKMNTDEMLVHDEFVHFSELFNEYVSELDEVTYDDLKEIFSEISYIIKDIITEELDVNNSIIVQDTLRDGEFVIEIGLFPINNKLRFALNIKSDDVCFNSSFSIGKNAMIIQESFSSINVNENFNPQMLRNMTESLGLGNITFDTSRTIKRQPYERMLPSYSPTRTSRDLPDYKKFETELPPEYE